MATLTSLKIAYTGGESHDWARKSKTDIALCLDLSAEVTLYDDHSNPEKPNKKSLILLQNQPGAESDGHLAGSLPGFIRSSEISFVRDFSISPVFHPIQRRKTILPENDDPVFRTFNDPGRHLSPESVWEFFKKLLQLDHEFLPTTAVTCQWMPS